MAILPYFNMIKLSFGKNTIQKLPKNVEKWNQCLKKPFSTGNLVKNMYFSEVSVKLANIYGGFGFICITNRP